ncbi:hypothetical protein [Sporomusa aerivorans]|uniref:hypothetical protein n=1 Tax=Sporomusa aerivorans TaxID=204936 RepID=UPI00352B1D1D
METIIQLCDHVYILKGKRYAITRRNLSILRNKRKYCHEEIDPYLFLEPSQELEKLLHYVVTNLSKVSKQV